MKMTGHWKIWLILFILIVCMLELKAVRKGGKGATVTRRVVLRKRLNHPTSTTKKMKELSEEMLTVFSEESRDNDAISDDQNPKPIPKTPIDMLGEFTKNKFKNLPLKTFIQKPLADIVMDAPMINKYSLFNQEFYSDPYSLPEGLKEPHKMYDFIIIGGGTTGSVVASRLSETKPQAKVLVLEAGKPEMFFSDIPALAHYLQNTDFSWPYTFEHQTGTCLGSEEQSCYSPRGKALGGSSVTDFMIYSRGNPDEWDDIASKGNYGWSYDDVLPYFKKSEKVEIKRFMNASYRGHFGPLTVEHLPFRTGLVEAFLQAIRLFGFPKKDYNAPGELGFGYVQLMMSKGHRMSAAKAYLHTHKYRKNLHIMTNAKVLKILIDRKSKRAFGVLFKKNGRKYLARCYKEIILSAGPIGSPHILMLSGIGPISQLLPFNIFLHANLPVGRNLCDPIAFPGVVFVLNTTDASLLENKVATFENLLQWMQFGDGVLTSPGGIEALGYMKTSLSRDNGQIPDVELISVGGSINIDDGGAIRKSFKLTHKTYNDAFHKLKGLDTWSAIPILLQPKSRGYMELKDKDPYSIPRIYSNYLQEPQDIATLLEAITYVIRIGKSTPFKKYGAKLHLPKYPTCHMYANKSNGYWECAIRTMMVSARHTTGTCKMGPTGDPDAVVSPEFKVHGIDGLRVADSSIFPRPISAHMTAPLIMIGEKLADMIIRTWSDV